MSVKRIPGSRGSVGDLHTLVACGPVVLFSQQPVSFGDFSSFNCEGRPHAYTWNTIVIVFLLSVLVLSVQGGRSYYGWKDIFSGRFDDPGAATGGVWLPPNDCLMTWQEFDTYVVGRDWIITYTIDDDFSLNPEKSYKFKAKWERSGSSIVRKGSIWNNITQECVLFKATFEEADPNLAIANVLEGTTFATPDRVDRFISCDPERFLLFSVCYVKPGGKRCSTSESLLMVPDQRPTLPGSTNGTKVGDIILNDIPWSKIEKTFKRCTRHVFVDDTPPQIEWLWQLTECPHPDNVE